MKKENDLIPEQSEETAVGKKKQPKNPKKRKKIIICVIFLVMAVFCALYTTVLQDIDFDVLLENIKTSFEEEEEGYTEFLFHEANYNEDIFKDKTYMALDRYVRYEYGGVTYTITDENYAQYGPDVEFFGEYFACLIDGDAEGYNALCSEKYYKIKGNEPFERFTKQKIYDMHILKQRQTTDEDGVTMYYYVVNYKIRLNNGSFRTDTGDDASRLLVMVLTDREGSVKIDKIVYYKTSK